MDVTSLKIQIVEFNSALQKESIFLRDKVLRKPLGLHYTIEQLKEEIRLAYKNQAAKLVTDGVHKWGGMMPNTTVDNFMVKRGGFNCTHSAIPKRKNPNKTI